MTSRRSCSRRLGPALLGGAALLGCWDNVTGPQVPPGRLLFRATSRADTAIVLSGSDGFERSRYVVGAVDKPAWSADGRFIAYQRQTSASRSSVWVVEVASGEQAQAFVTPHASAADPTWSPWGDRIAYAATYFDARGEPIADSIVIVNASGIGASVVTSGWDPAWGPDGRIAFVDRSGAGTEPPAIWLLENLERRTRLTAVADGASALAPAWSPTGRLAWIRHRTFPREGAPDRDEWSLMVEPSPGAPSIAVVTDSVELGAPAWSPEGTHLVFNGAWTGSTELWVVRADGTRRERITSSPCGSPCGNANASWGHAP